MLSDGKLKWPIGGLPCERFKNSRGTRGVNKDVLYETRERAAFITGTPDVYMVTKLKSISEYICQFNWSSGLVWHRTHEAISGSQQQVCFKNS